MIEFQERMIRTHGDFINRELTPRDKELLGYLLEGLTNIDTDAKLMVLDDLLCPNSKYNYDGLVAGFM